MSVKGQQRTLDGKWITSAYGASSDFPVRDTLRCQVPLIGFSAVLRLRAPLDIPDNRLPALVDVNVLDRDFLLALAAVAIERVEKDGIGAG